MAISIRNTSNKNIEQKRIKISLGWKEKNGFGNFDLDLSTFLLNDEGKVRNDGDFIFYNQLKSQCGSVCHQGDEQFGNDDGDAEVITIDLPALDESITAINICVTIHKAHIFDYSFGMVSDAYLRIIDEETYEEKINCSLSDEMSSGSSIILAQLTRKRTEWCFESITKHHDGTLEALAQHFGVTI